MRRLVLIGGLIALALAAPATAAVPKGVLKQAQQRTELMPGVTYEEGVQFTSHGPVVIHVLTGPRPGGLYELRPVLSNDTIEGRETVSSMTRRMSARATVAGVNGDLFAWANGRPSGIFMADRVLANPPFGDRSSVGVADDGTLDVRRVEFYGTWRGTGQRRVLNDLNQTPKANGISLFTPAWGPATPATPGAVEAVVYPFPPAAPNAELSGPVIQIAGAGGTPIPAGGAVLQARGTAAQKLAEEAPVGTTVTLRLILKPEWSQIVNAIGGGPVLVRDGGRPVFRAYEAFSTDQLLPRNPRTAVGQLPDGRVMLVTTDGRQPGYSVGMTNFELAMTMARLGATRASALDAGGSTTMAFEGKLLNKPSDPSGERPVAESLMLVYYGVYAPPPEQEVVSPNGDGVAETQALAYKLVRPSTVTATLRAPDGSVAWTETAQRDPGTYEVAFPPPPPPPAEEPPPPPPPTQSRPRSRKQEPVPPQPPAEGRWRLELAATDDLGRASQASRTFWVNDTLGFLAASPARLYLPPRGRRLTITATLAREARIVATIETRAGVVVRTLATRRYPAGKLRLAWDGMLRGGRQRAFGGLYVVRLVARNELGRVELATGFAVQRIAGPPLRKRR